jgi:beta-phosphoglucomutase-like phosphatase (HAD superfamily)
MGFLPSHAVVIEDAAAGVQAARAAGMAVLGFAARTPAEMLAAADRVFYDMADLPSLLLGDGVSARGTG